MSLFASTLQAQSLNVKKYSEKAVVTKTITEENDLIDGSTSASQLRAKKSHHVSKANETILSVSLGLISIGIIVFFLKMLGNRK